MFWLRGAIEDYYPGNVSQNGNKPDRALAACSAVTNREEAVTGEAACSRALSELEEAEPGSLFSEIPRQQAAALMRRPQMRDRRLLANLFRITHPVI